MAGRSFDEAVQRFDEDVIGFGTKEAVARGRDKLRHDQWEGVWPRISGFAFDSEGADVWVGPDGLMAVIAAGWDSRGRNADGTEFPRSGRASAVLRRDTVGDPWLCMHTHFSLVPTDGGGTGNVIGSLQEIDAE